jgi:hypothetical protein
MIINKRMRRLFLLLVLSLIILNSCEIERIEKFMDGNWGVTNLKYNGTNYKNGNGVLFFNLIEIRSDGTCILPMLKNSKKYPKGDWMVSKKNGKTFFEIKNCSEDFFNEKFELIIHSNNPKTIKLKTSNKEFDCRAMSTTW